MVTKFEAYKLKRELKKSGIEYAFKRNIENEFGEPANEPITIGTLKGLYHEQNSSISITAGDTTQTRTKKIPMILCLYKDATSFVLKTGDFIEINGKKYSFIGLLNIQDWNIIADISLEVQDNGL